MKSRKQATADGHKTSGRFGPYEPMRGARWTAEAAMNKTHKPKMWHDEYGPNPMPRSQGLSYRGQWKLRDWD